MIRCKEEYKDVVFADKCMVQLEQHSKLCFCKHLQPRRLKQRPKNPVKIHIWGGKSSKGATRVIMFTGIMNLTRLGIILEAGLLPLIAEKFSGRHRLFRDNDPKHLSHYIEEFFKRNNVHCYPTSPESSDLNPIENVWGQ